MDKLHLLALVTVISVSTIHALDWYALSQANYAAIQTGLAQLNDAASKMNQSMIDQLSRTQTAMDDLDSFVRQSLYALWFQYPNLNLTTDQLTAITNRIPKAAGYKDYVTYIADDYRQSVTNNVMIPAQSIVQSILSTMTTFYAQQWQSCVQQYASQLVQPLLSVGRLQQCITIAVPYFKKVVDTTLSMFQSAKDGVTTIFNFLALCTPNYSDCVAKFFADLPNLLANVVYSISNLNGLPSAVIQPGKPAVKECVQLITADIQDVLQALVAKTNSC